MRAYDQSPEEDHRFAHIDQSINLDQSIRRPTLLLMNRPTPIGLEGVVAFDTALSDIDGEHGQLLVRGLRIEDFGRLGFEAAWARLFLGDATEAPRIQRGLGAERVAAFELTAQLEPLLSQSSPMDAVRGALSCMPALHGEPVEQALRLTARVAVWVCAWHRRRMGWPLVAPNPARQHALDMHAMLQPSATEDGRAAHALDRYLTTVMEHGVNASTFAARTVASTLAPMRLGVIAGLCALEGPLHGGAPGPVLDMLDAVGTADRAAAWIRDEIGAGRRIMGMGHRVYRARDPRAAVLEDACRRLGASHPRMALARAVEAEAETQLAARHPGRPLRANVEFFTAVLLEAVGVPRDLFTSVFAAGRVVGWCAHIDEQQRTGRLLRPRARYVGTPAEPIVCVAG
jgi:citrate synthase